MNFRTLPPGAARHAQSGVTLVELMVGLVIGLFLAGAIAIIYVNTAQSSRGSTLEAQMNEDAALALEVLQQQIRLGGFSSVDADGNRLFSGRAVFGCDGGFKAYDTAAPDSFNGLECNDGDAADSIAVRFQATLLNSQSITSGGATLPGNCANEGISAWDASGDDGGARATGLALADNRYFIAEDADNGNRPTLYCQGKTAAAADAGRNGYGQQVALIPNIEDMQVQYAVTKVPVAGEPLPHQVAGYVEASHDALGATAANWSRVAALRVCLLVRSDNPVPMGTTEDEPLNVYRDCAGDEQHSDDRYLRRAYVTTIQLRNMRPALPSEYVENANPYAFLYGTE